MKKKNNLFSLVIIVFLLIVGGLILFNYANKSKLIELNVDEVIDKINNKDSFALCISQTTCVHCASYKPKLEKLSKKYDIEIFYIDIDKYSKEKQNEFKKYVSFDGGTPVTAFIVDGEEETASNRISGNISYDKVVNKFEKMGFIK